MTLHSPFDHAPDPELGAALREVLTARDDGAFVARILARAGAAQTWWEVLGAWSRPGLAAALVLTAIAGFWLGRTVRAADTGLALDEPVQAVAAGVGVTALFSAARAPDVDQVLAAANGQ